MGLNKYNNDLNFLVFPSQLKHKNILIDFAYVFDSLIKIIKISGGFSRGLYVYDPFFPSKTQLNIRNPQYVIEKHQYLIQKVEI